MASPSLHWLLASALLAVAVAAQNSIVSSNSSTPAGDNYGGIIELQDTTPNSNLSRVIPLTNEGVLIGPAPPSWRGNLYLTNATSAPSIESGDIAYLSCNPADYPGQLSASTVFETALNATNIAAAILYNTADAFCSLQNASDQLQNFPVFSMSSTEDSQRVLNTLNSLPASQKYLVAISRTGGSRSNDSNNGQGGQNPLGPSPSTAVAMIILYSITGIITALFLVIIITGAVRAHRNPERYGPRDVLGRPRQSRARGIGRAILDTIPIVKFGEREPPKPTDVELAETAAAAAEARAADGTTTTTETTAADATGTEQTDAARNAGTENASGIAPAAAVSDSEASKDENLGCSICTDDFEKGQDIRVLPCDHKFHPECVDPWLLNVSGTCPLCRVDLRPQTSASTSSSPSSPTSPTDPAALAPPLAPDQDRDRTTHRRSMLRDVLAFRSRPNASAEERISALRRLREMRRDQDGVAAAGEEEVGGQRRSRRISVLFGEAFGRGRGRGGEDGGEREGTGVRGGESSSSSPPAARAEASSSSSIPPARAEEASSSSAGTPAPAPAPAPAANETPDRPERS